MQSKSIALLRRTYEEDDDTRVRMSNRFEENEREHCVLVCVWILVCGWSA